MFNLNIIKGALVSTVLMGILSFLTYIIQLGDIFKVDVKIATNVVVMSLATGLVSLIKSLLTNDEGVFSGIVKVK